MRIAISTGGGDAPGLNAVIRAAALSAINRGWEVLGIKRGFAGLMGEDEVVPLTKNSVRGIAHLGGTILRTTSRGNPFHYPRRLEDGSTVEEDRSDELIVSPSVSLPANTVCPRYGAQSHGSRNKFVPPALLQVQRCANKRPTAVLRFQTRGAGFACWFPPVARLRS
jgi:hypothetical protein